MLSHQHTSNSSTTLERTLAVNPKNLEIPEHVFSKPAHLCQLFHKPLESKPKPQRKPNDISPVVATRYGYHIIKLLSRDPDTMPTFAQVKDQIVRELSTAYVAKANQTHTTDLSNMNLDLNAELVRSLQSRYLPAKADTKAQ